MTQYLDLSVGGFTPGSPGRKAAELANAAALLALSRPLSAGGTTTATTTSKVKSVNTITYTINGAFFSKAATDNLWTLGGTGSATTVGKSMFQKYALLLDGSGAASVLEGTQSPTDAAHVTWGNIAGYSRYAGLLTALADTKCIVAVVTIATDATHTFTPGTTAVATGSGITATFTDGVDASLIPLIASEIGKVMGNGG